MLDDLKQYLRNTSWPILAAMLTLMAIGVSAIRVAEAADPTPQGFASRQIWFAGAGLAVFLVMTLVPYQRVGRSAYLLFVLTLVLLVVVFLPTPLTPSHKGAHRWIELPGISVQPSEIAKLSFILLLAWYLRATEHYRRLAGLLVPFAMAVVPMALVLNEPDLGTSLLFLPTLFIMLFMAGAKVRHLLGILGLAAVLLLVPVPKAIDPGDASPELAHRKSLAYWHNDRTMLLALPLAHMEQYQLGRIDGWLRRDDPAVRKKEGWQLHQAMMRLGAGGWTGRQGWYDADTFFHNLSEDHTDFIFSVIGGQWGFVGCAAVLFLYAVIFLFGVEIATATNDAFARMLAVGVLAMLFTQLVINVGMTMGLMPVTGMTLPFISYGGSSLVVNCAALGLLVNVGQRRPRLLSRRPFEFGERAEKPVPFGPLADR